MFFCQILKSASQTDTDDGVQSVVSIKVTSDITAFCNASNEFGTAAVTFSITASEFLLPLVFPVSALCVYLSVCVYLLSSSPPPLFLLFLPLSCVSPLCLFLLGLKASSSAVYSKVLPVTFQSVLLLFRTRRCEAVRLLNVLPSSPSVLTGSVLPSVPLPVFSYKHHNNSHHC